jgi:heme/copper-type cytochrome/quinol oxidase subunit 2
MTLAFVRARSNDRVSETPMEIVLVGKAMAFRLADQPDQPNPVLQLHRGRPVNLVVRNEEPEKVLHCFTIGGLGVHTTRDLEAGESETVTFTPTQSGVFAYTCMMHPMMTGKVTVD